MESSDIVTVVVSVVTLIVNIFYYIFIQTRLGYKYELKKEFSKTCASFFTYLSELVSFENFDGVPTQIRNYSIKIHLCFKSGQADKQTSDLLEKIYQMTKHRKQIEDKAEIESWNDEFRDVVRQLRKAVSKYCGSFHGGLS